MVAARTDNAVTDVRLRTLVPAEFNEIADQLIAIYLGAMAYPPGSAYGRLPLWQDHSRRAGFNCQVAFDATGVPLAFAYGYTGHPDQWWHSQVRRGLTPAQADHWLSDYAELTELHVRPDQQGAGLGERVLRRFLAHRWERHVLLSTPEGENRAWRLYRRLGFLDVARRHIFTGDPRPFGILGLTLQRPGN